MKKLIVTLFGIFFITNSVLADGHVKRIISTSQTGMCTFYLMDGEKVFINYKGKGTGGQGGTGTFVIVGGTGKYENISGSGNSSRQNIRGKSGMAHSMNQMSGEYTY